MQKRNCDDCGNPVIPTLKQQQKGQCPRLCKACLRARKMERTLDKIWRKINAPQG